MYSYSNSWKIETDSQKSTIYKTTIFYVRQQIKKIEMWILNRADEHDYTKIERKNFVWFSETQIQNKKNTIIVSKQDEAIFKNIYLVCSMFFLLIRDITRLQSKLCIISKLHLF